MPTGPELNKKKESTKIAAQKVTNILLTASIQNVTAAIGVVEIANAGAVKANNAM